jgi:hypothetical protein
MSFELVLKRDMLEEGFGKSTYLASYKERGHISKSVLDKFDEVVYIGTAEASTIKHATLGKRYIAALDITYDLLVSIYEINTSTLFATRVFKVSNNEFNSISKFMKSFRSRTNFEARFIGMQNAQQYEALKKLFDFVEKKKLPLVEVDLFGNNARHIALDSKTGATYNILKNNILYKPGELANNTTIEQFEQGLMKKP